METQEEAYDDDFHEDTASSTAECIPVAPAAAESSSTLAAAESSTSPSLAAVRQIPPSELSLGRQLGGGAFSVIYQATWASPGSLPLACAAKVLVDPSAQAAFTAELRALSSFGSHPNLLELLGTSTLPRPCFITRLYGPTLAQVLRQGPPRTPWPLPCILGWAADIACALAHLHSRPAPLLHRDVKAANILLSQQRPTPEGPGRAVLVDFGLAGCALAAAGTPTHMAPELFAEGAAPTRAADVYALGTVLWAMLSGSEPWAGWKVPDLAKAVAAGQRLSLGAVREDCPARVKELLAACWREGQQQRPTAAALEAALRGAAAEALAGAGKAASRGGAGGGSGGGDSLDALSSALKVSRK